MKFSQKENFKILSNAPLNKQIDINISNNLFCGLKTE